MEQNVTVVLEADDILAGARAACGVGAPGGLRGALLTGCCGCCLFPSPRGAQGLCGTPGVSSLPLWVRLVLLRSLAAARAGSVVKGLPQSQQSCERNVRCCCHLLVSFPWFLVHRAPLLAPLRIPGLHLCDFLRDVSQRHPRN